MRYTVTDSDHLSCWFERFNGFCFTGKAPKTLAKRFVRFAGATALSA